MKALFRFVSAVALCLFSVPGLSLAASGIELDKPVLPNDPRLPRPVRERISGIHPNIFKLVSVTSQPSSYMRMSDYADLIKRVAPTANKLALKLIESTFERCKTQSVEACPFYSVPLDHFATAFLAENSTTIWTVRHAVESTIKQAKNGHLKSPQIPFNPLRPPLRLRLWLLDSKDNIVFDSTGMTERAELLTYVDRENRPGTEDSDYTAASNDFIRIKLSQALLGKPLEFSRQPIKAEEEFFVAGFSGIQPDRLSVSVGSLLPTADALPRDLASDFIERIETLVTFTNADIKMRGSGGPWLNKEGQVIGISARSRISSLDGAASHFGTSPKLDRLLRWVQ